MVTSLTSLGYHSISSLMTVPDNDKIDKTLLDVDTCRHLLVEKEIGLSETKKREKIKAQGHVHGPE